MFARQHRNVTRQSLPLSRMSLPQTSVHSSAGVVACASWSPPPADDPQHVSYACYYLPMMPPCPLAIVPALECTCAGPGRAPPPMPLLQARMPAIRTLPHRGVCLPYDSLMAPAVAPTLAQLMSSGGKRYHFRLLESPQSLTGGKRRLEQQYQEELDHDPLLEKVVTEITSECIREWPAITNEKQRKQIEKRRLMAMRVGFIPQAHHPSRQDHASRRPRDPSGRFLGKEDSAPLSAASKPEGSNDAEQSISSTATTARIQGVSPTSPSAGNKAAYH